VEDIVDWDENVPELAKMILSDAQTSGGLLVSIPYNLAGDFLLALHQKGITEAAIIGNIKAGPSSIHVRASIFIL
jgi:selenide,water dikinase